MAQIGKDPVIRWPVGADFSKTSRRRRDKNAEIWRRLDLAGGLFGDGHFFSCFQNRLASFGENEFFKQKPDMAAPF